MNEAEEAIHVRNSAPGLTIDIRQLLAYMALTSPTGAAVSITAINEPTSHTRLIWSLDWTDDTGRHQQATGPDPFDLLYLVAVKVRRARKGKLATTSAPAKARQRTLFNEEEE